MKKLLLQETESPFDIGELFVSMTDKHGVITAGNDVFSRVANYPRDKLIGRPHNLVRHPDMPKCVFKLFWDTLKRDERICAYVKNRASDGSYYWVLAAVIPTQSGYLSIRLKPSAGLQPVVESLYATVLEEENKNGVESALQTLLAGVTGLGFKDYFHFMSEALLKEIQSRNQLLLKNPFKQKVDTAVLVSRFEKNVGAMNSVMAQAASEFDQAFSGMVHLKDLKEQSAAPISKILNACSKLESLSLNMNICANKLGRDGVALSVVANSFQRSAMEISKRFESFSQLLNTTSDTVRHIRFDVALARLQSEMLSFYTGETILACFDPEAPVEDKRRVRFLHEFQMILDAVRESLVFALKEQGDTLQSLNHFCSGTDSLRGIVMGLDLIRLGGRLEGSRTTQNDVNFRPYIEEMNRFIQEVEAPIQELNQIAETYMRVFEALQIQLQSSLIRIVELEMIQSRIASSSSTEKEAACA